MAEPADKALDRSLDRALDEIRREAIESRNLVIKTDNQLKTLHAELKLVSKHQEDFFKRWYVGSAAAYLVIGALCGVGAWFYGNAKGQGEKAEKERLEKQAAQAVADLDKLKGEVATAASQERSALEVYKMMGVVPNPNGTGPDERLKGVDALAKLDLTKQAAFAQKVLNDRAQAVRHEIGASALERGKNAFRRQDFAGAATELNRFLTMSPTDEDAVEASYFLGNALIQLRKNAEAVPYLTRFVETDKHAKNRDYAMWMLIQALDQTGQREKGTEIAREAYSSYPNSDFSNGFRNRLAARNLQGSGASNAATPSPDAGAR